MDTKAQHCNCHTHTPVLICEDLTCLTDCANIFLWLDRNQTTGLYFGTTMTNRYSTENVTRFENCVIYMLKSNTRGLTELTSHFKIPLDKMTSLCSNQEDRLCFRVYNYKSDRSLLTKAYVFVSLQR